jgi:CRISPR-associated protein Csd1
VILQRLAEYYDRIIGDPSEGIPLPIPGHSIQKISFCVVLELDGELNSFQSLQQQDGTRQLARQMVVPGAGKPSGSGFNPCFLWDNSVYMLGYKPDDQDPARTAACFAAFRTRHLDAEGSIQHPTYAAVCSFLRSWSPQKAEQYAQVLSGIATNFGVFRLVGEPRYVHEAVTQIVGNAADGSADLQAICLVTGREGPIARLHEPKIKGVAGSQSSGALLVSFNAPAYESYGRQQSYNAPVGTEAAFKYANALNHLLDRRDRRVSLGDATVVFWADQRSPLEEFVSDLLADQPAPSEAVPEEDQERVRQARRFLTQLRDGAASSSALNEDSQTRFFLLGLSPNASRLSVRLWVEADAGELKRRLGQHLRDIQLHDPREQRLLTLRRITAATGRAEHDPKGRLKGFDTDSVSPQLAGALARAVLTGGPYPQSLLSSMLRRIRSDGEVHYTRVSAIKACLVRNSRMRGNSSEVSVSLDPTQPETAYNIGRLFALLEKIQTDSAEGELNATIKDRYFASASATPAAVFPRLFRLSQHHMGKLSKGSRIYYEKLLGEVMAKLDAFPRLLPLEEQGRFVIGYFHQRQELYSSNKSKTEGATA